MDKCIICNTEVGEDGICPECGTLSGTDELDPTQALDFNEEASTVYSLEDFADVYDQTHLDYEEQ